MNKEVIMNAIREYVEKKFPTGVAYNNLGEIKDISDELINEVSDLYITAKEDSIYLYLDTENERINYFIETYFETWIDEEEDDEKTESRSSKEWSNEMNRLWNEWLDMYNIHTPDRLYYLMENGYVRNEEDFWLYFGQFAGDGEVEAPIDELPKNEEA